jgi:glucose-1-phosphate cytidylyltransferase
MVMLGTGSLPPELFIPLGPHGCGHQGEVHIRKTVTEGVTLVVKVVIFCGGMGMRMRTDSQSLPKPMTPIGNRPVLWHLMRYYAHFGHTEFILCLGYGASAVKDYFLNYRETTSNDFVLRDGGRTVELCSSDLSNWEIAFVDTGVDTAIGERLRRVRSHLGDEKLFLANSGDVLTDAPLDELISRFAESSSVAQLLAVKPQDSFHVVSLSGEDQVTDLTPAADLSLRINGGYFVMRQEIFDYLAEGDDLVADTFAALARQGRLLAHRYDGFWAPMDTLKERAALEEMHRRGRCPWMVWEPATATNRGSVTTLDVATLT